MTTRHATVNTVTASIISTGELDKLPACLRSLAAQRFDGTLRVVVVCNGCGSNGPDHCVEVVAAEFPGATVLRRATRGGFGENHNQALAQVPSNFGLVLNPDVVLDETCVAELVGAMERHPRAGVVGPLLRYPSGAPQPSARRFPRPLGTVVRRTPLRILAGRRLRESPHYLPPPREDRMVDWILGACLMVRSMAWLSLGGFDPEFRPLYVEDVDLAWRTWQLGWEVWQTPEAVAMHEHQAATDKVFFDKRTAWHARGMWRFVRKHPAILWSGRRPVPGTLSRVHAS